MASTFGFKVRTRLNLLFGLEITGLQLYYFVFLLFTILSIVGVYRLQHSRLGRAWQALREDRNCRQGDGHQHLPGIKACRVRLWRAWTSGLAGMACSGYDAEVLSARVVRSVSESVMILAGGASGMGHIPGVIHGCRAARRDARKSSTTLPMKNVFSTTSLARCWSCPGCCATCCSR